MSTRREEKVLFVKRLIYGRACAIIHSLAPFYLFLFFFFFTSHSILLSLLIKYKERLITLDRLRREVTVILSLRRFAIIVHESDIFDSTCTTLMTFVLHSMQNERKRVPRPKFLANKNFLFIFAGRVKNALAYFVTLFLELDLVSSNNVKMVLVIGTIFLLELHNEDDAFNDPRIIVLIFFSLNFIRQREIKRNLETFGAVLIDLRSVKSEETHV